VVQNKFDIRHMMLAHLPSFLRSPIRANIAVRPPIQHSGRFVGQIDAIVFYHAGPEHGGRRSHVRGISARRVRDRHRTRHRPADRPRTCLAAAAADDADRIIAICGALIDGDKTLKADRIKALIARAGAYDRKDMIDRAIGDYDTALRLDPTLSDIFNIRGELWRRKGDRPRALQDFAAAIKLNPQHEAARANYKSLAQELERLGAEMAIKNKPIAPLKSSPPLK
jgi:tetratricopeptide (TPR) repeat protein